ncbi:MAG TPA: hypothetical protein VMT76_18735 [Puia sp.]|nr:hypothetical protein [Puia sp.]
MKKYPFFLTVLSICFFSCSSQNAAKKIRSNPQKVVIYKENVYDLCGYEDEGNGIPFNLFDENAYVDPATENKSESYYLPETNPQPADHPDIYFPGNKGNRIVADLQVPYKLTDIYVYDRSKSGDSVWIYTGDMMKWKLKSAFAASEGSGNRGWRKFTVNDSSQYVMIRFSSPRINITEMVLYGTAYKPLPERVAGDYTGTRMPKKMMKDFLGVNYFNSVEPKWIKPFHYSRLYIYTRVFDDDISNPYPQNRYNMLHDGYWHSGYQEYYFFTKDIKNEDNAELWYTVMGEPLWMNNKGMEKSRPVTQIGMDTEDPLSYGRHANMMWNIAAFFGNSKVDTNLLSLSHKPKRSGLGIMGMYENGNEDDATWIGKKYCNPVEYFAQSSADYDGYEGRLGKMVGIKNADSSAKLMMSGLIELDTNRVRVYKFLCNTLRKDKKFIWNGGIQYHHYSTNGKHGITPEEDSLRWKLSRTREATYKIEPSVPCILGENGYDKSQNTRQGTPMIPGFSEEQCQGIFILRSVNATVFSGFDAYVLYWLRDAGVKNDPSLYLSSGVFRQADDGKMEPLAAWYYISTFVNVLGNYVADEVVNEKGNVWVYKYRNKLFPDSAAYFIYCPTHNGTKVDGYKLKTGVTADNSAMEIDLADGSVNGKSVGKKIVNSTIELSVEEKPKFILLKEKK